MLTEDNPQLLHQGSLIEQLEVMPEHFFTYAEVMPEHFRGHTHVSRHGNLLNCAVRQQAS